MKIFNDIFGSLLDTLFPRLCAVCEASLASHERYLCTKCLAGLPRTLFHRQEFNPMEQLFAGKVLIERAIGFIFYEKDNPYSAILHKLKYYNMPHIGQFVAEMYARELQHDGILSDIDAIIPIPLHPTKQAKRGYNQSEHIAQGFAEVMRIPMLTDVLVAIRNHESQTNKGIYERWLNTQGIFDLQNSQSIENKHILIVDDVVTTGATLLSAALTLADIPGIKISLATIGVARLD